MNPRRPSSLFGALRLALATAVEAIFADSAGSSSGTWLTIRAVLLVGVQNVVMVVAGLGWALIMLGASTRRSWSH